MNLTTRDGTMWIISQPDIKADDCNCSFLLEIYIWYLETVDILAMLVDNDVYCTLALVYILAFWFNLLTLNVVCCQFCLYLNKASVDLYYRKEYVKILSENDFLLLLWIKR